MDSKHTPFYRPELDVIRFIAFFLVFLSHVFPGNEDSYVKHFHFPVFFAEILAAIGKSFIFGLSIFFFLSAYLITTLLLIELKNYGRIDLRSFYLRRILRIWPLYFTAIFVGISAAFYSHPDQLPMFKYFIFFGSNFYYQDHSFNGNIMEPLWSISVEEQFYFIFPLLLGLFGYFFRYPIGMLFLLFSLSALAIQGTSYPIGALNIWTNPSCQFLFFGTGILCAVFTHEREIKLRSGLRIIFLILSCALFFSASFYFFKTKFPSSLNAVSGYAQVSTACVFLLFSFLNSTAKFPEFLLFLGKISYGLYVWHRSCMFLMTYFLGQNPLIELLAIFPTIAVSFISYRYLERPFLKLKNKFTYIKNRPV